MTAKKTVKSAKAAPAKSAKKSSGSSGLLSKLKGALAKKPAPKPAAKKAPAKKAAAPAKPAKPAAKVAKPAAKKPAAKPAPSKPVAVKAKPAPAAPAAKTKPAAAPAKPPVSAVRSTTPPPRPATPPPAPIVTKPVPKKKLRPTVYSGALTEDILRDMNDDEYMNEAQLEFFRKRLIQMRLEVLQRELDVKERLHEREVFADPADRATAEEEHWLDLRLRERESLLLRKVDDALRRIEAKEYGYCEKTGDPIGIPRLLARPTATVCVDVKGQDERVEAQYRDR